ncbi:TIGR01457 family HAD-type hydrolase [Chryseomicrobium sp. FSL W7-1435]|uniref:TIGR01457 family HAD-type hydrolase n=1 Tax=Chryseomicrobium sp. FSL W7-1435 TaxID=2921704 RepID=UPI003159E4F0
MFNYKIVCLDLDGTVYKGVEPIPEAVAFIHELQRRGIEPFYITNNASMSRLEIKNKLQGFGIQTEETYIYTSGMAAAHYVKRDFPNAKVYVIGTQSLRNELTEAGLTLTEQGSDAVVMGIDKGITYDKLAQACLEVRSGAKLIATNPDHAFPSHQGLLPGNGAFVRLVEYSTETQAIFCGKPSSIMLELIQSATGVTKEDMVLIGDNSKTDLLAGINYEIATIHVNSGVDRPETIRQQAIPVTHFVEKLTDLL